MKMTRIWIEYEDDRGDRYMAPASNDNLRLLQSKEDRQRKDIRRKEEKKPAKSHR